MSKKSKHADTTPVVSDPWDRKSNNDYAREARNESRAALRNAETAARRNDHAAAKKWAETAQRMADTAAQLVAMPLPETSAEETDAIRAEILARIAKYIDPQQLEEQGFPVSLLPTKPQKPA